MLVVHLAVTRVLTAPISPHEERPSPTLTKGAIKSRPRNAQHLRHTRNRMLPLLQQRTSGSHLLLDALPRPPTHAPTRTRRSQTSLRKLANQLALELRLSSDGLAWLSAIFGDSPPGPPAPPRLVAHGSGGLVQDLVAEQLEAGAAVHASLGELHAVNVPFGRSVAVRQGEGVGQSRLVAGEAG